MRYEIYNANVFVVHCNLLWLKFKLKTLRDFLLDKIFPQGERIECVAKELKANIFGDAFWFWNGCCYY